VNIKFEQYSDEVYYEPLNEAHDDCLNDFIDQFVKSYQSGNIKLDISLGIGIKYLDVISI
jgi:hypothetical protein